MNVTLTADGRLQLVDDQTVYPPLTIEGVRMLADSIPQAQAVIEKQALTNVVQEIATILGSVPVQGTFTVDGSDLSAHIHQSAFDQLAAAWDVVPVDGSFEYGAATITTTGT